MTPSIPPKVMAFVTAGVAGPALIISGWHYPGSWYARGVLVLLGASLSYANYLAFTDAAKSDQG